MLYNSGQRKWILLGIIIFLGGFILFALRDFLTAIIGSAILYILFRPFFLYLTQSRKWNRGAAAALIIFLSFVIILLPLFSLTWMLVDKIVQFRDHPESVNAVIDKMDQFMGIKFNQPDLVPNLLKKFEGWLTGSFPSAISRVVHILLMVFVMYFIVYFMFVHGENLERVLLKYVPFPEDNAMRLASELKNITHASVLGHGLIALSQGILFGVGFLLFGIPNALFWGVVIMLLAFIPLIGPPAVIIPTGILLLASGDKLAGFGIMLYGLILVTSIEYFLRFYISRKIGHIHPVITVLGLIIGLPFFGVLGLVIGPLLVGIFVMIVRLYESDFVEKSPARKSRSNKVSVND